jgi:tetratricopeptide (TPR) repeat protein
LHEGRRLLKRGQADKALIQLRQALNLYTAAKNNSGMAATYNELGDLYLRQGQYQVALDNYQKALDGFIASGTGKEAVSAGVASAAIPNGAAATGASAAASAAVGDDRYNANLMLAKIGEVNYRLGKLAESQCGLQPDGRKETRRRSREGGRRFGGLSASRAPFPLAEWMWRAHERVNSCARSQEGARRVSRVDCLFELRAGNGPARIQRQRSENAESISITHCRQQAARSRALQNSDRCDVSGQRREPVSATLRCDRESSKTLRSSITTPRKVRRKTSVSI